MSEHIRHHTYPTHDGHHIGVITLDKPKALNAQDLQMIKAMTQVLDAWQADGRITAVVLHGAGDKALCAGGDIKSLALADSDAQVADFFHHEYQMMHQMHTYAKPIVAWGDGIVMGGGLGLLSACSHKLVTPRTLMAMPEVSIGLFPDAGGSWFLSRMMGRVGLFLGLTGARWTGADALYLGLGDVYTSADFDALMATLTGADWQSGDAHAVTTQAVRSLHECHMIPPSQIITSYHAIQQLMHAGSLRDVDAALLGYTGDDDYIKAAIDSYRQGSDTTKAVTWRLYHHAKTLSLQDIYALEKIVAYNCVKHGDFAEGVRALLIDKDKDPKWRHTLTDMPSGYVDGLFGG